MTDHGREIPLGDHAYIVVFASYTNPDAMSGPTRVILDLDRFRGSSKPPEFDVSFLETYRLGSLTGFRYVAAIDQPNGRVVREAIVVVSADEGIEVTVAIQGPQAVYHARRPVLQSILKSWRASPRM